MAPQPLLSDGNLRAACKQHLAILAAQEYDSLFVFDVLASHIILHL